MKTNHNICLVAGNSAGHILPALTIAQKIKLEKPAVNFIFFSNNTKLDQTLLTQNPLIQTHVTLNLMPLPYSRPWKFLKFTWQIHQALKSSYRIFKKNRPQEIISTGGLIAIPVCLVARFLKIPITIYELNVEPGKATKFLAKFATQVKICFAKTAHFLPQAHCQLVNYPTRFTNYDYQLTHAQAFEIIQHTQPNFKPDRKTILILGGSQGSLFINQLIPQFILKSGAQNLQIIHQTGQHAIHDLIKFYQAHQVPNIVFDYQANLMPYYRAADLIICRAGAGTLAEIIPLHTPCITIPLATGYTSHQIDNALEVAQENVHIKVLKQTEISENFDLFYKLVNSYLN